MSLQDDYDALNAAINGGTDDLFANLTTSYRSMRDNGANPVKLAICRALYRSYYHISRAVCNAFRDCASTVPGVQPLSGGQDKNGEDDPE